jgi:lipoic acid synthetase
MRQSELHTVCEEAHCPNIAECWGAGTATFMILGSVCTRTCGFCAVTSGRPTTLDLGEPARVADAIARLGLRHAVITSVNRDELPDGGAQIFAATIRQVRQRCPTTTVEVLIPDFQGVWPALELVMRARPDILNHNIETVARLYRRVRPSARYQRSLELLQRARALDPTVRTKSGFMLGLGETWDEILETLADLRRHGVEVVTIGQYLRPSAQHLPVERYVPPAEFGLLRDHGRRLGFQHVEAGPLVRSSYHAERQVPEAAAAQSA